MQTPMPLALPIRALQPLETLPPGHATFPVLNDEFEPHLKRGEFAVVDTTDTAPQSGEVYIWQSSSGARRRKLIQLKSDMLNITGPSAEPSLCWWLRFSFWSFDDAMNAGRTPCLSDGPVGPENISSMLVGRVVGFAGSDLGGAMPTELGFLNEQHWNGVFDPAEYVDAYLATGHTMAVHVLNGRPQGVSIGMPVIPAPDAWKEGGRLWKVGTAYARSSHAPKLVCDELMSRGLTCGNVEPKRLRRA